MRFFLLLLLLVVLHLCFAEPGVGRSSSNEVNSEALSIASIVEALSSQTAEEELEFGEKPPGSFSGFPKSYEVRHLLLDPDDPVARRQSSFSIYLFLRHSCRLPSSEIVKLYPFLTERFFQIPRSYLGRWGGRR